MTSDLTLHAGGGSPFDQIRLQRTDGTEYWSARDLMPLLGYPTWQYFKPAIDRAMTAAEAQGHDVAMLFMVNHESSGGRPREDFHLARFAAYLVAMNGDPRKTEVAAAQHYFAERTREAETAVPVPALTEEEIVAQALAITTRKVAELEERNKELAAPAAAWGHMADAAGDYAVGDAAKMLSRDPNISIGRNRLFDYMYEIGWLYRQLGKRPGWRAYQDQVDLGRLTEKAATPFLNGKTGGFELPPPTVRITAKGLGELHRRLGGQPELAA